MSESLQNNYEKQLSKLSLFCDGLNMFIKKQEITNIILDKINTYENSDQFSQGYYIFQVEGFCVPQSEIESEQATIIEELIENEDLASYFLNEGSSIEIKLETSKSSMKPPETFFTITIPGVGIFDTQWKAAYSPKDSLVDGTIALDGDFIK